MKVIDGNNAVLGRLASITAKNLLAGEEIVILNAEKIVVTGNPKRLVEKYLERRRRGSPQHGPFFPKQPNTIVHRAVRGMMPYKTQKGRDAMKKLKIYIGVPDEFKNEKFESIATKPVRADYIRIGDIAKTLGWHQ